MGSLVVAVGDFTRDLHTKRFVCEMHAGGISIGYYFLIFWSSFRSIIFVGEVR